MTGADRWRLLPGPARLPDAAAPDVRGRSYEIVATVMLGEGDHGVLLAHGDRHSGYALRIDGGALVHHYVHAAHLTTLRYDGPLPTGAWVELGVQVDRIGLGATAHLMVDGIAVASGEIPLLARARTGYTGLDVGCDRGMTVAGYPGPARFSGQLRHIVVTAADDQWLDEAAILELEGATG